MMAKDDKTKIEQEQRELSEADIERLEILQKSQEVKGE